MTLKALENKPAVIFKRESFSDRRKNSSQGKKLGKNRQPASPHLAQYECMA